MAKLSVERKIARAARTYAEHLDLSGRRLTKLPDALWELRYLKWLDLSENHLTELPPGIGRLRSLEFLGLQHNSFASLPPEIRHLRRLRVLALDGNPLPQTALELQHHPLLEELFLVGIPMQEPPSAVFSLRHLTRLDLESTDLRRLPPAIGALKELQMLNLRHNRLRYLPLELAKPTKLLDLGLEGNPLESPPPAVVAQGTWAVLTYLRERLENERRQWLSKLLLVGEGGVGKSSILRALRREEFIPDLPTTHGIEIRTVGLEHPTEPDVEMSLNAWDFGGQQIYHATHQFFLTARSLFLLAWNARLGYEQGKLYYWLDMIEARAPESPVILVATHVDEREADLPLAEIRARYPQVVGSCSVSNRDGVGISELREALRREAAELPLMGERWPKSWLDTADDVRTTLERHVTPARLDEGMASHGVAKDGRPVLARWLHELGDLLWFQDDPELNDRVILEPQWVTEYIDRVLVSEEVANHLGILTRECMERLWADLEPGLQDHFLCLMEQFDLSYRTLEDQDKSLVVELLSLDPPEYQAKWDEAARRPGAREISMVFRLNTVPAGIPTWFIARSHRFTTHTHWRHGALFAYDRDDPDRTLALVRALPHERELHLTVRGPSPQNFFALLRDGLELTLARYPGLKIRRLVPCPGHDGEPCCFCFDQRSLDRAVERDPPIEHLQCQEQFEDVPVSELLFGIHWSTQNAVLERIDEMEASLRQDHADLGEQLDDLRELAQRGFTQAFRREQANVDSHCPNVFALRPQKRSRWRKALSGERLELQLYCQAPGHWHPTTEGGLYTLDKPARWLRAMAPYLSRLVKVFKHVTPLLAPSLGMADSEFLDRVKHDVKLMTELVKQLPEIRVEHDDELPASLDLAGDPERATGAALRALRHLLDTQDPARNWGGLRKRLTPEGHYLWLCEHHWKEYD